MAPVRATPTLVRWPLHAERRTDAARAGAPCLLVVDTPAEVPAIGPDEDWILLDASERDAAARLALLAERSAGSPPPLDALDVPEGFSGTHARIARILLTRRGYVVPWADLTDGETDVAAAAAIVRSLVPALRHHGCAVDVIDPVGAVAREAGPR